MRFNWINGYTRELEPIEELAIKLDRMRAKIDGTQTEAIENEYCTLSTEYTRLTFALAKQLKLPISDIQDTIASWVNQCKLMVTD